MIYSTTRYNDSLTGGDPFYYVNKQIIAAVLGFVVAAVAMLVDYRYFREDEQADILCKHSVLASLVFVLGTRTKGAINWIRIGPLGTSTFRVRQVRVRGGPGGVLNDQG